MTAFILLVIIPITFMFFYSYSVYESIIENKISVATSQTLEQVNNNLQNTIDGLSLASIIVSYSQEVSDIFSDEGSKELHYLNLKRFFRQTQNIVLNIDFDITIITSEYSVYSTFPESYFNLGDIYRSDWYERVLNSQGYYVWEILSEDFIPKSKIANSHLSLLRIIKDTRADNFTAILIMSIDSDNFASILKTGDFLNEYMYIIDNDRRILFGSGQNNVLEENIMEGYLGSNYESAIEKKQIGGDDWLLNYSGIRRVGWTILRAIDYRDLTKEIYDLRSGLFMLTGISFIIFVIITYAIIKSSTIPIKHLLTSMQEVEKGNLDCRVQEQSIDEIGQLTKSFNTMLDKLQQLLKENESKQIRILEEEAIKKDYKYKMLQSQINPHFLFNVLNNIKWMAVINKAENVADMIASLGHLLEASIGKKGEEISIKDEINYLDDYIKLQKTRYGDKFNVIFKVDREIYDYYILKLLLQPIVENSIIHGLSSKEEGGLIVVKGFSEGEDILFEVQDNGKGIERDCLNTILKSNQEGNEISLTGIGIRSTNERIKLYYGNKYGIHIDSRKDYGTLVKILIPKRRKNVDKRNDS